MRTYFAIQGNRIENNGAFAIFKWAEKQIKIDPTPIKIFTARPGERDAKVIGEITTDGIRYITNGRTLPLKTLICGKE